MSADLFASFQVNHEEAKGGVFEPLPVGEYEVVAHQVEATKSKQKGTPELKITWKVREDMDQAGKKRNIFDSLYATEGAMWKFQQLFKALGFENGKKFPGGLPEIAKAVQYQTVRVKIKHESYTNGQGEQKVAERVEFYTPSKKPITGGMAPADPFADGQTAGEPFTPGDDDLPF